MKTLLNEALELNGLLGKKLLELHSTQTAPEGVLEIKLSDLPFSLSYHVFKEISISAEEDGTITFTNESNYKEFTILLKTGSSGSVMGLWPNSSKIVTNFYGITQLQHSVKVVFDATEEFFEFKFIK